MRKAWNGAIFFGISMAMTAGACDLCAVYNRDSANGGSAEGFSLSVAEQYVPFDTLQLDGEDVSSSFLDQAYVHSSISHFVPGWNFSERFGLSLNIPYVHKEYKRFFRTGQGFASESGTESGLGDASLIARLLVFNRMTTNGAVFVNLLAGIKAPTGDDSALDDEVSTTEALDLIYGVGHQHAIGGVHLRDLAVGSGSWDGVFGVTMNSRWKRMLFNAQLQYYLRTEGESGYEYGDEWMLSGGPGTYLWMSEKFSMSLQALAVYDDQQPDRLLGRENRNTGMRAFYLGPQVSVSIGAKFTANAGVDLPLSIDNRGFQNVPDWRLHFGAGWKF